MITQSELKKYFYYDPKTGIFSVKKKLKYSNSKRKLGENINTCFDKDGYLLFSFKTRLYRVHRIVFLYMTGKIPKIVDHIDGNKTNNKWKNLRVANISQNCCNLKKHKDNTTGYKGVFFYKDPKMKKPWYSRISKNKKRIFLGCFSSAKEAAIAYDKAAIKLHKQFANLNFPLKNYREI